MWFKKLTKNLSYEAQNIIDFGAKITTVVAIGIGGGVFTGGVLDHTQTTFAKNNLVKEYNIPKEKLVNYKGSWNPNNFNVAKRELGKIEKRIQLTKRFPNLSPSEITRLLPR